MAMDPRSRGAAAMLSAALALAGCAVAPPAPADAALGVRIEGVRLSAAGYLLDLRYRVVDPGKAGALFERRARPVLLDPATGLMLGVPVAPKLGQLRPVGRQVKVGRTYSMLFANPGRAVARGTRLALLLGEARIDGLAVE